MDERVIRFLDELKSNLEGLAEAEIAEAVGYYGEYLNEAAEEGKDLETVLGRLDSPQRIAAQVKMEASINYAQKSPGLKSMNSAVGAIYKGLSTPLSVIALSIPVIIGYSLVILFFGGAFAFALAAVVSGLALSYEALSIPLTFWVEMAGTLGAALFSAGICMLLAISFYWCGRKFIALSAHLMKSMLGKKDAILPESQKEQGKTVNGRTKKLVKIFGVVSIAGIIIFGISGMPFKLFAIFNSMKPESGLHRVDLDYDAGQVGSLSINTAHSVIRVEQGSGDKVILSYEEPEWMTHEAGLKNGVLEFREKSNGRYPLFSLVTLHESMTELKITLPAGFKPDNISLESRGGHIYIRGLYPKVSAKTLNGRIDLNSGDQGIAKCSINAETKNGSIQVESELYEEGIQGAKGFSQVGPEDYRVDITSTNGNIFIK